MADIEWLVDQVDRSPEGPHIGAFFDFDGTIIAGYSALAFFKYRLRAATWEPRNWSAWSARASTSSAAARTSTS